MSRNKKSRSLKRVTGGVKTGSKERTKLENKQNKARKKAAGGVTAKQKRQRSIFQKALDQEKAETKKPSPKKTPETEESKQNNELEPLHAEASPAKEDTSSIDTDTVVDTPEQTEDDLWDQLENPNSSNTF